MNVLVLNCGSSSLKFGLFEKTSDCSRLDGRAGGVIGKIGGDATYALKMKQAGTCGGMANIPDHENAIQFVLNWLTSGECSTERKDLAHRIDGVGHRVVHGGSSFSRPVRIEDATIGEIESYNDLAPLHNPVSIRGIRAARSILGQSIPMVAVFDTSFHATIPEHAHFYAIPYELSSKYRIKRYGLHGTAHRYMSLRYGEVTSTRPEEVNVITIQLGNGSSITALRGGKSIDTSMGFTPLEGLVMGTRCGDVDPAVICFLARKERLSIEEIDILLNFKSGLLGVSGHSNDMSKLLDRGKLPSQFRSRLAVDMFCYRVRKYIGAYLAALGGAKAVVFGGGIGENSPLIRAKICEGMEWAGLKLDHEANAAVVGSEGRITSEESTLHVYVIPVDEERLIAEDTIATLAQ